MRSLRDPSTSTAVVKCAPRARTCCSALAVLATLIVTSCVVPEDSVPFIEIGLDVSNKYVHRGMVQNEEGVVQPSAVVVLPTKRDGAIIARTWANMDLSNETGEAWFPDGHAGKFSQIDFNLLYEQQLDDAVLTAGFISYNLPNGLEFPFGERGATTEFLVEGRLLLPERAFDIVPYLALHYDFDEVDGLYARAGAERVFQIDEKTKITADLGLAWMDSDQAAWNFAQPDDSGLADLILRGTAERQLDKHTTATGFVVYSTVLDSEFRDWFDVIGIDPDQFYVGLGVRWAY